MMFETLLIANIFASAFMTGLIWFVQLVHYPGFLQLDPDSFYNFHHFHVPRTGWVVIPPMITELVSSIWLVTAYDRFWVANTIGLALVALIWISTFALQVKYHRTLSHTYNRKIVSRLITTNWLRTILWTAKIILGINILAVLAAN